jgi:FkbH-like protein
MSARAALASEDLAPARASIILSATFTAEPLVDSLDLFMRETGLGLGVTLAPYDQVFQELLDRTRPFSRNPDGVNVVLVRFEDWVRQASPETRPFDDRGRIESLVDDLAAALRDAAASISTPIVVCVCPSPLQDSADLETKAFLASLQARLETGVASLPSVHLLPTDRIGSPGSATPYDAEADRLGHLPYTPTFFASLAMAIARLARALKSPPRKVLVFDCDNTLWKGAVGEEGVNGVEIGAKYRALQSFALAKKKAGMLLCLASKNAEADVTEVLRERPEMVLRVEDIASMRVNWLPKSENLRSLAAELNLGLDSFAFIDDNPLECAEVEANCPEVLVVCLPIEDDFPTFLANVWPLDQLRVTDEDLLRTELYRQNRERSHRQASATSFREFLAGLELRIDIEEPRPEQLGRSAQLTQRTNQFNLTTRRRTEAQLARLANEGKECRIVQVKDRFGDYGLVGLLIFGVEGPRLAVDTWLLSCRALGRGVEHAMLRELGTIAQRRGLSTVAVEFSPTKKNLPARVFLDSLEAVARTESEHGTQVLLAAEQAAAVAYTPGEASPGVAVDRSVTSIDRGSEDARSARWNRIARELSTPDQILTVLAGSRGHQRPLKDAPTPPRTKTERRLCAIWAEELGLPEVGIRDDYFDLGGTSLLAVAIFARVERELGNRLPLAVLMERKTVEALAAHIDHSEDLRSLVVLERGGSGPPLFLVHDADGETLLYRNLARTLGGRPVYGIQPPGRGGVPMTHTRIEEMAAHYVTEIRKVRPHGPYLLGGLCAGGILAFEMARQLEMTNEEARLVAVFDAADVSATMKPYRESAQRASRLRQAVREQPMRKLPRVLMSKARGFLSYQVQTALHKLSDRLSVAALRRHLDRGAPLPGWARKLSVRAVYARAEAEYRPAHVLRQEIVLFRATEGVGFEQPFVEIYDDPLLGWSKRSLKGVKAIDVPGGHGSMLQEPNVSALANALGSYLAEAEGSSPAAEPAISSS